MVILLRFVIEQKNQKRTRHQPLNTKLVIHSNVILNKKNVVSSGDLCGAFSVGEAVCLCSFVEVVALP